MTRRLATAVVCLATLAAAPAALGQIFIIDVGGDGVRQITSVQTNMRVTGSVSVDFHGDAAAGCAAAKLCDVDGRVTWSPRGPGAVLSYGYVLHGQRFEGSFSSFGFGDPEDASPFTSARVRRAASEGVPGGLCADAVVPSFSANALGDRPGTSTEIGLIGEPSSFLGADSFRTRCAGPSAADLRALLPTHVVSERFLRRGHAQLDFSTERSFAAGGLAGTLHSNVVFHLGRSQDQFAGQTDPGPTHERRRRAIDVRFKLERVSGQVVTGLHGLADPDLCGPLDACGLMGTVTTAPSASAGTVHLSAESSLHHSRAELQQAVGLRPGGRPEGVSAFGYGQWAHERGTITTSLARGRGSGCTDSRPIDAPGAVTLAVRGKRVVAFYGDVDSLPFDALRTRCPGPSLGDVAGSSALARGTLPLTAFAHRHVTLHLTTGGRFASDGYAGSTRADVTIVLRRTRIRQYIQSFDLPVGVSKLRVP
jgi:hypothetical protein